MNADTSPPMGQVNPFHHSREPSANRSPFFYQNTPHCIQQPPAAYISHAKRMSETQRTDTTRVQSSISSGESGSSAFSYQKQRPSQQSYWQQSSPEGYENIDAEKNLSQWDRTDYPSPRQSVRRSEMVETHPSVIRYIEEQRRIEAEDDQEEDDHAPWVLFWLSILDPFHSIVNCLYTLFITLILVLLSPLRLCRNQVSFGDRIIRLLAPFHRHHLQMLCAPSSDAAHSFEFKPMALMLVLLASPFISIGVAVAAWVSAAFWVFAFIMGNPDGTERRDDGRDAVLSVRNWWERYFLSALKDMNHSRSAV